MTGVRDIASSRPSSIPDIACELDIEHRAIELGMLEVGEERLRRVVGDRLDARRPQQPGERPTDAFIVVDDADVGGGMRCSSRDR